jgi:DNA replication protein DnaC
VIDVDAKADRERWYAERRQKAISSAERVKKKFLESYPWYEDYEKGERVAEIALAKAEVAYTKMQTAETSIAVEEAKKELAHFNEQKTSVLECAGLTEKDLEPKWHCAKCKDTGFVNGYPCDCYEG